MGDDIFAPVPVLPFDRINQQCELLEFEREIHREIGLRKRVYSRWVEQGKLKQAEADRRIAVMDRLLAYIQRAKAHSQTG